MKIGAAGLTFLILIALLILCLSVLVLHSHFRHRSSGLHAPSWRSCIPFASLSMGHRGTDYPRPRSNGLIGWTKYQLSRLTNTRPNRRAYEDMGSRGGHCERRRHASADGHEDPWDAVADIDADTTHVGAGGGADSRRYDEEQELGTVSAAPYKRYYQERSEGNIDTLASDGGREQLQAGSTAAHDPHTGENSDDNGSKNPFDDQAEGSSLGNMSRLPEPVKDASTKPVS